MVRVETLEPPADLDYVDEAELHEAAPIAAQPERGYDDIRASELAE